jgi:ATP-dependent DNA helicase RecQ
MSAVSRTGQRFGTGQIVDIVTGADTQRIRELGHDKLKTYGAGKGKNKKHWWSLVDELIAQEALIQEGDPYPVLKLTVKGSDILFGRGSISALRQHNVTAKTRRTKHPHGGQYDETLFEKLRMLRKKIADAQHLPPYIVFSDRTLGEMCKRFPSTLSDMRRINGVGDAKLERYGKDFILEIRSHIATKGAALVTRKSEPSIKDA